MNFRSILFIAPNYKKRKGGIASVLNKYAENIEEFQFFSSTNFQNKTLSFVFLAPNLLYYFLLLLLKRQYQIIHIHGASKGSFYRKYWFYFLSKKVFSKKVIYHIHGGKYHLFYKNASPFIRKRIKEMIINSDVLIVLSHEWKTYFKTTFHHNNIQVVKNIVDKTDAKTKKISSKRKFVFLGKIGDNKGVFDLLKLLATNPNYYKTKMKLKIGGDGEVNRLKKYIKENNLADYVEYLGWISGEEKNRLLKNSDIMILPSYNEGLPISLLEAMSYSMPIIATNVGGIPKILDNYKNGIMIEPGNLDTIKKAITFYIENPQKVNTHGARSYEKVKEFFPNKVFNELDEIYKNLT